MLGLNPSQVGCTPWLPWCGIGLNGSPVVGGNEVEVEGLDSVVVAVVIGTVAFWCRWWQHCDAVHWVVVEEDYSVIQS